jgi:hypothetical protein
MTGRNAPAFVMFSRSGVFQLLHTHSGCIAAVTERIPRRTVHYVAGVSEGSQQRSRPTDNVYG